MNILNLLTKKKHFAGVEIGDSAIRIAYFRPRKKSVKKMPAGIADLNENELVLKEETIPTNVISNGIILNKEILKEILKNLWKKEKLTDSFAVVSISEDKIYSNIFPFPKTVNLKEAVDFTIDFQLPVKRSDEYIGWENAGDSKAINEIIISAIPKTIINDYIEVLNYAGVKMLALESHLASIARSIKLESGATTLLTKKNPGGITIFILKDGIIKFSRTLPENFIKEDSLLTNEIKRMKNSFESENKISVAELPFIKAPVQDKYLKYSELSGADSELQSKWLIAIGAVIRGEIPKGQDDHISLLPVGTAEAYKYQRAMTFITLIRNLSIAVSLFFLFSFLAAYFFIFSISQTINNTNSGIFALPVSPDITLKEALIKKVNSLTLISQSILSNTPTWSILIDEINAKTINGIILSSFKAPSVNDIISLTGIAKNRDTLNQFKKSLQGSAYTASVELPITNLEQKENIPFSISFRLKDPGMLYYK